MAFFSTACSWNPATPWLLLGALVVFQGCGPAEALKDAEVNGKSANQVAVKPVLVELAKVNRGRIEEILERAAALLAQHLIVLVDASTLVPTLHEAYARIALGETGFGWFLCGPSKTADIEQSLVLGAHGPRRLSLVLV